MKFWLGCLMTLGIACCVPLAAQQELIPELVVQSQANPSVHNSDEPNVVLVPSNVAPDAPLAIFMPGTDGTAQATLRIERVIASQGYRVIGLSYDDMVAGNQLCWKITNPLCLERFREMRSFGQGIAAVQNNYAESTEGRLTSLLQYLNREHQDAGWSQYLAEDGKPRWSRILVSGLSQGAGMAAFIAKQKLVYRVVLFSSPWDSLPPDKRPASWMFGPSVTPMDRWWAERHARENTTGQLATAYRALRIPTDHLLVFNQDLPTGFVPRGDNPFHAQTVMNPAYEPQWRQLFGLAGQ